MHNRLKSQRIFLIVLQDAKYNHTLFKKLLLSIPDIFVG